MPLRIPLILTTLIILLSLSITHAQPCGTDELHQQTLQIHPELHQYKEQVKQEYIEYIQAPKAKASAIYTIPVVVHVVHNNGNANIPDAQVIQGIEDLNDAFENVGYYDQGTGVDVEIEFCLAIRDPNNNPTTGINRIQSDLTSFDYYTEDIDLKNLSRWDPTQYLNMWTVLRICGGSSCEVAGYAYFPFSHGGPEDGIVCEAQYFGSFPFRSSVIAHEVGHYLGLYHTFDGGCINNNCLSDGDQVCDTPPDGSTANVPCDFEVNTCTTDTNSGFATDQNDMIWNYMDYTDQFCSLGFTEGQKDRMQFFLTGIRASLLASDGCLTLCPNPYIVEFTGAVENITIGTTLNFNNISTGGTDYEWLIDGVPFANTSNASYTFNTLGTHTIQLVGTNGDPLCTDDFEVEIEVTCPLTADFTASNPYPIPGEELTFSENTTGTGTYNWTVDDVLFSNDENPNYTFAQNGPYNLCLEITNGLCSETHCQYIWVFIEGEDCGNTFLKTIGSNIDDEAKSIVSVPGGGFVLGGGKGDSTLLSRIDADGNEIWSRTFKVASGDETMNELILDSDGFLIGAGWSIYQNTNRNNYVFKYDYINNNMLWFKQLSSPNQSAFQSVLEKTSGGNYLVIGQTSPNGNQGCDALLLELDRNSGNTIIQQNYNLGSCETFNEAAIYDNHIYLTGRFSNAGGSTNKMRVSLTKIDFSGNEIWSRLYLTNLTENARLYGRDITIENDKIFVLSHGDLNGTDTEDITFHLHKTDLDGNLEWAKTYDISGASAKRANALASVDDGFLILGSYTQGSVSAFMLKTNKEGAAQWSRSYDFSDEDRGYDLFTKSGGIYMIGEAERQSGSQDVLIGKLNLEGETRDPCDLISDLIITENDLNNAFDGAVNLSLSPLPLFLQSPGKNTRSTFLTTEDICVDPCEEICDNGIDDDYNGFIDCEDVACACDTFCLPPILPLDLGTDVTMCENGIHTFDAGAGHDQYIWQNGSTESTFTAYDPGEYWVTVIDSCDMIQSDTVLLEIAPLSEINFENITICPGDSVALTVNDFFDTFTWTPEGGLSCNDCASVTVQPQQTTEYRIIGTSDLGCITIDTFEVKIGFCGAEICGNDIDDDGDGLIDCYDPDCCDQAICADFYYDECPVDCEFIPDNTPFQMEEEWRYDAGNWHSYNTAITGDIDGDGIPEVIGKTGPYTFSGDEHNDLLVINGQTGNLESTISTPSMKWSVDAVAIADINRNGFAEIIIIAANDNENGANQGHLHCYEFDGTQYQLLWISDQSIDTNFNNMLWSPSIADFDGDGDAEVYVAHQIFDGITGELLVTGGNNNRGILADDAKVQTVAVDVLPDSFCADCAGLELVAGNQVYSVTLDPANPTNNSMNVEVQASGARDGYVGIADLDRDGDLDAVIVYAQGTNANVYIWDIQTPNQLGTTHTFNSTNFGIVLASQPNIADIDDNGTLDIGICGVQTYRFLTLIGNSLDLMWSFSTSDNSGNTGSTIFDFEGDGDKEIVYRDEDDLRIFDAAGNTLLSVPCSSGTSHEYPVIVDVDADGETELLCSCNNQVRAYGSAAAPWVSARSVWNQHSYFNVNINDDLTVSPFQQQHHIVGDSMVLNNFLTQYSNVEFPAPDADITVESTECAAGEFNVSLTICNMGDNTLSFETPITFYDNNPTQTAANPLITLTLGQSIEIDDCLTQNYTIPALYNQEIYVIVNDDASLNPVFSLENDFPVTAIAECDFTNNIDNFIIPLNAPTLNLGVDTTVCNGEMITLDAGSDFTTYEWQDGSMDTTFTTMNAGVYSVTVTDECGNTQSDEVIIILEECCELAISTIVFNIDCANEFGSIITMTTDGLMPYTYLWSNGAETPDISNLPIGTYTVTVTDNEACTATATTEIISLISQLNISANEDTLCLGESATLTATGADYYEWTPTTGLNNPNIPDPTANPNTTTTYTVTGYTRTQNLIFNGDFEQGNIGFTSEYNVDNIPNDANLLEGDYSVGSSPTFIHSYLSNCGDHTTDTTNMMVVNAATTPKEKIWCQTVNVAPNTYYDFSTWVASVFPASPAILQFSINDELLGSTFTPTGTTCIWQEFNEIWNSGTNTSAEICIVNQNTVSFGNDLALDDIAFSTLCTATEDITIYRSNVTAMVTNVSELACTDLPCTGTATAVGSGGFIQNDYTYEWSDGQTTATATDLCVGTHTVTLTDDAGCAVVVETEVTQDPTFTIQSNILNQAACSDVCNGSASVMPVGGTMPFTYLWSTGATTATADLLCEGINSVTITDADGCINFAEINIVSDELFDIQVDINVTPTCSGVCNASASATPTGGTMPLTYLWSNGESTPTANMLCEGINSVTITDIDGCENTAEINLIADETFDIQTNIISQVTCSGICNGSASATPAGGDMPFTYTWDNGANTETITNLCAGNYAVTITDTNGCQNTAQITINDNATLMFENIGSTPVSCFGGNDGTASASATGGIPPYTYTWSNGEMTETISDLAAGVYTVVITDASGCPLPPVNITITEPLNTLSIEIEATDPTCNGLSDGFATALPEGGTPIYSYQWSNGSTAQTALNLLADDYTVTVSDANGCTMTAAISLIDPLPILADISTEDVVCFGDETGTIMIENPSGGLSPYVYSLDGENYMVSNFFTGLAAGAYSVHVQDAQGCVGVFDALIVQPPELLVDLGADITVELSDSTQLFAQSNSTDSLSYAWSPPNGLSCIDCPDPIVNILDSETYNVIITDEDGCTAADEVTITIDKTRNIFIPNVFSPNNDGTNDIFMIYGGKGVVGVLELKIYDRWGELVFENYDFSTDDPATGWDGSFRGQTINPAVFVYHTKIEFFDGVIIPYVGDVTLVR